MFTSASRKPAVALPVDLPDGGDATVAEKAIQGRAARGET